MAEPTPLNESPMKFIDLNPQWTKGHVSFDCPLGHPHRISIPVSSRATDWNNTGDYPTTFSLTPSIHAINAAPNDQSLNHPDHKDEYDAASKCGWHGFVTNGEIVTV